MNYDASAVQFSPPSNPPGRGIAALSGSGSNVGTRASAPSVGLPGGPLPGADDAQTREQRSGSTTQLSAAHGSLASPFAVPFSGTHAPSARVDSKGKLLRLQTTPDSLGERKPFPHTAHPAASSAPLLPLSPGPESARVSGNAADMHARILALQRSRAKKPRADADSASPASADASPPAVSMTPTAAQMASSGAAFGRSSSFRTRQRSSLSARRGMNLNDNNSNPGLNLSLNNLQIKPKAAPAEPARTPGGAGSGTARSGAPSSAGNSNSRKGLFSDYRKYIDIETGTLNFAGKACVHAQGIEFSSGEKFNISLDKLQFVSELGVGNYGTVQRVLHTPNNVFMAVKEIRLELDESAFRQIIMELDVLHRCEMSNIIAFYGAFFVEGAVYICMEYMDGGSVNQIYEGGIPEKYLKYITKCVVQGLRQLKEEFHIIHRDVKPTNILCSTSGEVKLCDFGVSGNLVASIAVTNIGCQSYMAPERINAGNPARGPNNNVAYTVESDIWSLGLSLIEMATGEYPYAPESYGSIFSQLNAIVEDPAPMLDPTKYSPEACDFVARMLDKSPAKRPRYSQIAEHPWLQSDSCTKEEMGEFVKQRLKQKEARAEQQQQQQQQKQQQQTH